MKKAKWLCTAAAVLALSVAVAGCGGRGVHSRSMLPGDR